MLCTAKQRHQQAVNIVARREERPLVVRVAVQETFPCLELREIVPRKCSVGHSSSPAYSIPPCVDSSATSIWEWLLRSFAYPAPHRQYQAWTRRGAAKLVGASLTATECGSMGDVMTA